MNISAEATSVNPTAENPTSESQALLVSSFEVCGALCAIEASLVEEVVRSRGTTPVPHSPPYVLGIMNLRGKIVSVIDLGRKLELGASASGEDSRLYIVRDREELVGLLVDRTADVIEVDTAALEPPPANIGGPASKFFRVVARTGGKLITILDTAAALAV